MMRQLGKMNNHTQTLDTITPMVTSHLGLDGIISEAQLGEDTQT